MFNKGIINSHNCNHWASQSLCFDLALYPLLSVFCPTPARKHSDKSSHYCLYTNLKSNPPPLSSLPWCWPGTAGHVNYEHTFTFTFFPRALLPWLLFEFVLKSIPLIPFLQISDSVPMDSITVPISFSSPFYFWVNRSPAAIRARQCSDLIP